MGSLASKAAAPAPGGPVAEVAAPPAADAVRRPARLVALDVLRTVLVPGVLVVLWEIGSRTGVLNQHFVPPPSTVAVSWYQWIFGSATAGGTIYTGTWAAHSLSSARRVLIGFAIAALVGTLVGVLIGWFRAVALLLDPLIQTLRPIPITAWVPFAIVFWGIQEGGAISLIALGAFFPVVVNSTAGAARTPKVLVRAALMLGTRPGKLLWRVVLPSALPSIFTGLRLGIGVAWVLVIVSEMVAVKSGLGYVLWDAYFFIRMDIILAAMFSVGILGFLSDALIVLVRNQVLAYSRGLFHS
jgi:NitT/TauT family transport system permease protein